MCGINGFNFVNSELVKKMNVSLKHRGPDADGIFMDRNVSMGHTRLAVIDLSKLGSQPMKYSYGKKKVVIVFNGEIYNYKDIKKDLLEKGYKFKSNTDTEVIVASYFEWGTNCVKKFNGMWAFCIYDINKKLFFLSRDRLGQKPIYYYFDGEEFVFSSEIKSILNHNFKIKLDKDAVNLYFSLGFIPSPYSIYENINKIEARQNLVFDLKKKKIEKKYYFDYPKYCPVYDKKKLIKEGKELFEDATKICLMSDVPLGAFLSGGVDSSTVVYEMKKFINKDKLNTFSVGFDGEYDESMYINIAKNYFGTRHHHKYFEKNDFEKCLSNIFYFYDEPFCDPSMFPMVFLSRFARSKLTVALSGDGGDEIFGGYPRYRMALQLIFLRKIPILFREIALKIIPNRFFKLREGLRISLFDDLSEIYSGARPDVYKPEIYKKIVREKMSMYLKLAKGNLIEAMILMDRYFQTMADNFLCKVDRASMAHSLEVRSPFLDYRFIEYASKIPTKWKISWFKNKVLMKEIIKDFLPDKILNRKKMGFTPPVDKWICGKENVGIMKNQLNELFEKKILNKKWSDYYYKIFEKYDVVSKSYKIRLFFFHNWWKYWENKIDV